MWRKENNLRDQFGLLEIPSWKQNEKIQTDGVILFQKEYLGSQIKIDCAEKKGIAGMIRSNQTQTPFNKDPPWQEIKKY